MSTPNVDFEHPTLLHCMQVQARVLHALFLREAITRFGRHNLGVLWLFCEPMLFTVGVMSLWILSGMHHGTAIPIPAFAVTGYSSVLLWRNCASRSSAAVQANANLLYHRSVHVLDVMITRILIEVIGASASFAILCVIFVSFQVITPPKDIGLVLIGWIMLAWFGASLALVIGAGSAYSEVVDRIWHPVAYLLFPLSGAAFMVDWLPKKMQTFVLALPMVHGVEILRAGYFGGIVPPHYNIGYMALICLLLTWLGIFLCRDVTRYVEVR